MYLEDMKGFFWFSLTIIIFVSVRGTAHAENSTSALLPSEALDKKISDGITLKVQDMEFPLLKSDLEDWFEEKGHLSYSPGYRSEIENIELCASQKSIPCELTSNLQKEFSVKKFSNYAFHSSSAEKFLDDIARKIDKDPINATLKAEDGKISVFSLSKNGLKLNKQKSLGTIAEYFENETQTRPSQIIVLAYEEVLPEVSTESIENLGITSLIGEGRSNFRGSPKNRIFNIKVATNRFNGVLIKPGEEFSFVKILGEVDGEHGYLPELVIKKDKTEPEFGGGICQVSTTAFRAAIYSGLEITARKNHAYPVQYYNPQGMDATVYVPRPDLRFLNDTPGHILIQTKIEGTELIFQFYGAHDGRTAKVIGPEILEKNADGSMKTTFTQQIYDKDNVLIREDVFRSNYDSPSKYPHPASPDVLTQKPKKWSDREWDAYKKEHGIP